MKISTSSPTPQDDALVSAAVYALLSASSESVADLAFYTRISTASLYRKLSGEVSWRAADVGAVSRHFGVDPGALFAGAGVLQRLDFLRQDSTEPRELAGETAASLSSAGTRSSTDRASDYGSELGWLTPVLTLAAA